MSLNRLSQTENASDQTRLCSIISVRSRCVWIRHWSASSALDSFCALEKICVPDQIQLPERTFDQTHLHSQLFLTRLNCARNALWSKGVECGVINYIALKPFTVGPSCTWTVYDQTKLRFKLFMIRLKCSRNRFWSNSSAFEVFSSEYDFIFEQIFSLCYKIFIS